MTALYSACCNAPVIVARPMKGYPHKDELGNPLIICRECRSYCNVVNRRAALSRVLDAALQQVAAAHFDVWQSPYRESAVMFDTMYAAQSLALALRRLEEE
jgi:hypothetical protein